MSSRLHVAPILKGHSKCLSCGEALRPYDLVPIVSWLYLRGKCRYCKVFYGYSPLVVELLFGVIFLLLYMVILSGQLSLLLSTLWLIYYTLLFIILGVMALYDRAHSYIPLSFLVSYLTLTFFMYIVRMAEHTTILGLLSPIFVALPFLLIWLITRGKGLGFGDIIVFVGVGAFFGSLQGLGVLIISVWIGAIVGLYYKYVVNRNTKSRGTTAIPFVPFIVLSFLVVFFTGIDIMSIAMYFS